jgi:hypothetical protein
MGHQSINYYLACIAKLHSHSNENRGKISALAMLSSSILSCNVVYMLRLLIGITEITAMSEGLLTGLIDQQDSTYNRDKTNPIDTITPHYWKPFHSEVRCGVLQVKNF